MSKKLLWQDSLRLSLTTSSPGNTWTMPQLQWADCSDYLSAFALIYIDYLATSGGTVTIKLQSAVVPSLTESAWVDVATVSSVSTTGPQVLKAHGSVFLTGVLRLQVVCSTAVVNLNIRAQLLMKNQVQSRLLSWVDPFLLGFGGSGSQIMSADQYEDCAQFLRAFALVEYASNSGSGNDLTVAMETAPSLSSDTTSWSSLDSGTLANPALVLDGVHPAPMGALRLKYTAAAALSGIVKAHLLLKYA